MEEDFKRKLLQLLEQDCDVKGCLKSLIDNLIRESKKEDKKSRELREQRLLEKNFMGNEGGKEENDAENKRSEGNFPIEDDAQSQDSIKELIMIQKALREQLQEKDGKLEAVKQDRDEKEKQLKKSREDLGEQEKTITGQTLALKELEKKFSEKTEENEGLRKKITEKEKELEKKEETLEKKENEVKTIFKKYIEENREKEEVIREYNDLRLKYSDLDKMYSKYLSLGEVIIQRMERILNASVEATKTAELFMAYGVQENNILALWESIATNFDFYDSQGKTDDLVEIFRYFLGLYKEITFKEVKITLPIEGETYDERKHTRTVGSNAVGKITKVILPGFVIGKNIAKKALVIVR